MVMVVLDERASASAFAGVNYMAMAMLVVQCWSSMGSYVGVKVAP